MSCQSNSAAVTGDKDLASRGNVLPAGQNKRDAELGLAVGDEELELPFNRRGDDSNDEEGDDDEDDDDDDDDDEEEREFDLFEKKLSSHPELLERYFVSKPKRLFAFLDAHQALHRQYLTKRRKQSSSRKSSTTTAVIPTTVKAQQTPPPSSSASPYSSQTLNTSVTLKPPPVDRATELLRTPDGNGSYPYSPTLIEASLHELAGDGQPWRAFEADACVRHMLNLRDERLIFGEDRFEETANRLGQQGIKRSFFAVKNYWNRKGRARSGWDERTKRPQERMATSLQHGKRRRGAEKEREEDGEVQEVKKGDWEEGAGKRQTRGPQQQQHRQEEVPGGVIDSLTSGTASTSIVPSQPPTDEPVPPFPDISDWPALPDHLGDLFDDAVFGYTEFSVDGSGMNM